MEILKAHGSRNDIFIAPISPDAFASDADLREFVRALCDRSGPLGGDGIYLYAAGEETPRAWFVNPDGSSAEFCGNGMRCLGRVILDQRGTDHTTIRSGATEYAVARGPVTAEGVQQIRLEHPEVRFCEVATPVPDLDPVLTFTSLTVPNPHLVTIADKYVEADLVEMGRKAPHTNVSVLVPVAEDEIFVRTHERGAGLTASCGSGMVAARAVYSRLGHVAQDRPVAIHNAGGAASVWLRDWHPVLQGNATYVYRAEVDPAVPLPLAVEVEVFTKEAAAYSHFDGQNEQWLLRHAIDT
jgi:diaminopimelate epimerase